MFFEDSAPLGFHPAGNEYSEESGSILGHCRCRGGSDAIRKALGILCLRRHVFQVKGADHYTNSGTRHQQGRCPGRPDGGAVSGC